MLKFLSKSYASITRPIWLLALITLISRSGSAVLIFFPIYMTTKLNFSLTQTGYALSMFGLGSILGSYLRGGALTDESGP